MQKFSTLLVSLLMAANATAETFPIYKQPEGKLYDKVYMQVEGKVLPSWIGYKEGSADGLVGKIVEDAEGNLYVYNLLASHQLKTWAKISKTAEGKYFLQVPQAGYEYGDDKVCNFNRLTKTNGEYVAVNQPKPIEYSWDGTTLQLLGTSAEGDALGLAKQEDGAYYNLYGLIWKQCITTMTAPPTAPKAETPIVQYEMNYKGLKKKRSVSLAFEGDLIFIKGFVEGYNPTTPLDEAWIVLQREGNKATFTGPQYLGVSGQEDFKFYASDQNKYHTYAVARAADGKYSTLPAETAEFTINDETRTITAKGILALSFGKRSADDVDLVITLRDLVFTAEGSATPSQIFEPATPTLVTCYSVWNYEYTELNTKFMFHTETKDIKGNSLPTDKLHYNIFVNKSSTPYTFAKSRYKTIDADKTDVPYLYIDPVGYVMGRTADNETFVNLTHTDAPGELIKTIAVQIVYTDVGKVLKSQLLEVPVKLPTALNRIETTQQDPIQIYRLDGRKSQKILPGLNLVRETNGKVRKVLK